MGFIVRNKTVADIEIEDFGVTVFVGTDLDICDDYSEGSAEFEGLITAGDIVFVNAAGEEYTPQESQEILEGANDPPYDTFYRKDEVDALVDGHADLRDNPHVVTATQAGAEPANANIQAHIIDTTNPHGVTATQAGAISTTEKGAVNGVAELDGSGKVPVAQIPATALPQVYVVSDATARLALTVQEGDEAKQTDDGSHWIYDGSAWHEYQGGAGGGDVTGPVSSVDNSVVRFDGLTGKIIQGSGVVLSDAADMTGVAHNYNLDGTPALPAYSFYNSNDMGMYRVNLAWMGFAVAGNRVMYVGDTGIVAERQVRGIEGTAGNPTYSFGDDGNTGMYNVIGGEIHFTCSGADVLVLEPGIATVTNNAEVHGVLSVDEIEEITPAAGVLVDSVKLKDGTVEVNGGSASYPGIHWSGDTDTGLFSTVGGVISHSVNGVNALDVSPNAIHSYKQNRGPYGSATAPQYSFETDTDTGMFGFGNNTLAFSTGGTIRQYILSNGALYVTTANYENLVVADDYIPNRKFVTDYTDDAVKQAVDSFVPNSKSVSVYDASSSQAFSGEVTKSWDTQRYIDSSIYAFENGDDYLQLKVTGQYLVMFEVTTDISSGTSRSDSQVFLQADEGSGWTYVPGTNACMYNRTVNVGCATGAVNLVFNCTVEETNLRVRIFRENGSSNLFCKPNGSRFTIVKIG